MSFCWHGYGLPSGSVVKNLPAKQDTWVWSLGWKDPLEKEMATYSSNSCLGNPMDRGVWWATVHRVAKSRTRLHDFTLDRYTISLSQWQTVPNWQLVFFKMQLWIYLFWLCCLSLVAASGSFSSCGVCAFLLQWLLLFQSTGSNARASAVAARGL